MGKIYALSEALANQIAAGEVVEHPASVVKELVENAIDAQATRITVRIENAGLDTIEVSDNGEGIATEDLPIAFTRHATSKIKTQRDLFRVHTLGFRGEALPSIASVSQLTIQSKTADANTGMMMTIDGGNITQEPHPVAMNQGTIVIVSSLFYNTPARLKYIKKLDTERGRISTLVQQLAMSHPDISFKLINDDNELFYTTGNGDIKQVLARIYGMNTVKNMIPIQVDDLDFSINGYVSLPELNRSNRKFITLILNGRCIKNIALSKAIIAGYGSKLMVNRYPIAVIAVNFDPTLVDVNVHPSKQEVRLSKEEHLCELIREAIQKELQARRLIPDALQNHRHQQSSHTQLTLDTPSTAMSTSEEEMLTTLTEQMEASWDDHDMMQSQVIQEPSIVNEPVESQSISNDVVIDDEKDNIQTFPMLEYIGQMHGTYLFAQSEDGLYIIDQHAAQERIKYEYYRVAIGDVTQAQQQLLTPMIFDFTLEEHAFLQQHDEALRHLGIILEPFGKQQFIMHTHPTWIAEDITQTTRELLDLFIANPSMTIANFREETAIMMSCKRSIKANHHLNDEQARRLLQDLAKCKNPYNCPHGRPVTIHFSTKELEKMFKRIQDPH